VVNLNDVISNDVTLDAGGGSYGEGEEGDAGSGLQVIEMLLVGSEEEKGRQPSSRQTGC
jgi:hypothetical protein